jgi:hypothetical protein
MEIIVFKTVKAVISIARCSLQQHRLEILQTNTEDVD